MKRHTSTYLVGSEDLPWRQDGMDIEPLASVTTNPTPKQSSKSIGQKSRVTKTSEKYEASYTQESLFSQEDFHANHLAMSEENEDKQMTATSGLKCLELYAKQGPVGCLAKMLLASKTWHSTRRCLTWKAKITKSNRLLFQLVPSMLRTEEIESGSVRWMWPSPRACELEGGVVKAENDGGGGRMVQKEQEGCEMGSEAEGCCSGIGEWSEESESSICRILDGVSNRVDRCHALGNAIVPQVAAEIIRCINQVMEDNK
jgi:hypothetical protein